MQTPQEMRQRLDALAYRLTGATPEEGRRGRLRCLEIRRELRLLKAEIDERIERLGAAEKAKAEAESKRAAARLAAFVGLFVRREAAKADEASSELQEQLDLDVVALRIDELLAQAYEAERRISPTETGDGASPSETPYESERALPPLWEEEARELARRGETKEAVRRVREVMGLSWTEAEYLVASWDS
jgi:hypothetical protein